MIQDNQLTEFDFLESTYEIFSQFQGGEPLSLQDLKDLLSDDAATALAVGYFAGSTKVNINIISEKVDEWGEVSDSMLKSFIDSKKVF